MMKTKKKQLFRRRKSCYPNDVNSNTTILSYIRTVRRLIDSLIYRKIEAGRDERRRIETNRNIANEQILFVAKNRIAISMSPHLSVSPARNESLFSKRCRVARIRHFLSD